MKGRQSGGTVCRGQRANFLEWKLKGSVTSSLQLPRHTQQTELGLGGYWLSLVKYARFHHSMAEFKKASWPAPKTGRGVELPLLLPWAGWGGVVPKHPQRCGTRYWGALQTPPISKSGVQFVIILHPRSVFHLSFSQIKKSVAIPSFIRYYSHQNKPW